MNINSEMYSIQRLTKEQMGTFINNNGWTCHLPPSTGNVMS